MLTKTSLSAIRLLVHLAQSQKNELALGKLQGTYSPKRIASELGESPTYLAKITGILVKAGILRAQRGVKGGIQLNLPPDRITLLLVVEACQGTIIGDYCREECNLAHVCAFHDFGVELHRAIVDVLSRWTLAQIMEKTLPSGPLRNSLICVLEPTFKN